MSGTTTIILTGGTWKNSGGGTLKNNLQFAGNVTLDNVTLNYNTGTITYTSGTITPGTSTLALALATTLNTPAASMSWNNITISAVVTITLGSDLRMTGTLLESAGGCTFSGAFNIYCGAYTINGATTGTTTLSGNIIASGLFSLANTTSTTFAGSFPVVADSANISGTQTVTLVNDMFITNTTTIADANVINGAFLWNTGGLTTTGALTGTATILFSGTGTWQGAANCGVSVSINPFFPSTATLTLFGTVQWGATGKTLLYVGGGVITTGSTLSVTSSATLNTGGSGGVIWENAFLGQVGAYTMTLNSLFTCSGTMQIGDHNGTWAGTAGFTVGRLTLTGSGDTITLTQGNTYTITSGFQMTGGSGSHIILTSSDGTLKVPFILQPGATQAVKFIDAVRLDSSTGQGIYTSGGTLTTDFNWFNTYPFGQFFCGA